MVKNLPAMQETCVLCLVWEDLLEKGQATHSGILAWEVPWTEEPGGLYNPWGGTELDITDSIFKSRDITLPTKVHLIKAMVFPMVMYGCESRSVKKAEHRRIDAFELWCWRRLESPLDCKEIQPVHSEGDQPWDFFGRNDANAETPVLWPPDTKS